MFAEEEVWDRIMYFDVGRIFCYNSPSRLLLICLQNICSLWFFVVWLPLCSSFPPSRTLCDWWGCLKLTSSRGLEPVGIMALRSIVAPWSDQLCHLTLHHNMIPSAGCRKGYLGELFTHCSPDLISYPVMKFSRKRDSETQGSIKTFLGNSDWQPLVDHNFNWLV